MCMISIVENPSPAEDNSVYPKQLTKFSTPPLWPFFLMLILIYLYCVLNLHEYQSASGHLY